MSDYQHRPAWERQYMDRVRGESRNIRVDVHIVGLAEIGALILAGFKELKQEIQTMSQSISDQIDAGNAALSAAIDAIQTDVTAIAAELQAAVPAPGGIVTQSQVDAMNAQVARLQAVKSSLDALVVPPPATP